MAKNFGTKLTITRSV